MAGSPLYKVYTADNEYIASVKHPEFGAVLLASLTENATLRFGHRKVLWTEGKDGYSADSYDKVVALSIERMKEG